MTLTDDFLGILNDKALTGPQRGAAMTAAIKRFKTSYQMGFVVGITEDMSLDMTLPFARSIITELFGRTPDSSVLNEVFATSGRGQGQRSSDNTDEVMAIIKDRYSSEARELDLGCDREIAEARAEAQARREPA